MILPVSVLVQPKRETRITIINNSLLIGDDLTKKKKKILVCKHTHTHTSPFGDEKLLRRSIFPTHYLFIEAGGEMVL